MKTINRISKTLKVIGVVLVLLSLVLAFYALTAGGNNRDPLLNLVRESGSETSIIDNISFDRLIYKAMSMVANDKETATSVRAARIIPVFDGVAARMERSVAERNDTAAAKALDELESSFDYATFLESYEQKEDQSEKRAITKVIDELDQYQTPAKPGKPALKPASCEPDVSAAYEQMVAEHGEAAGSYLEYLETVAALIKEAKAAGTTIATVKAFVVNTMTWDAYAAKLPEIQTAEREQESGNLLDSFAELCEKKVNGEAVDFSAFFDEAHAGLQERYANETLPSKSLFITNLITLIGTADYDGSYETTIKTMRNVVSAQSENSVEKKISTYCSSLVTSTDELSPVTGFGIVWFIVSTYMLMLLTGIALLILSRVLKIFLTNRLLKQRKESSIQEESDVLLRVEHLKQYFSSGNYVNRAVDDVSFFVKKGEVFGLVGESGCGKTTTGRTIINLYDPTEGDVYFEGLRISSTEKGLPILLRQKHNDLKAKLAEMKRIAEENAAANPNSSAKIMSDYQEEVKQVTNAYYADVKRLRDNALESSVEKSKCVQMYREKRKAELTEAFEAESKTLSGEALEARRKQYKIEMKAAAKDNIMTRMQMIFQDPIASINPRMTVREIIAEGLVIRGIRDKDYINKKVNEMLELVGLVPEHADRYPHEFSGGQRQRIGIARAIVMEPDLIIADEPISALDVSIQAQVINLMNDLRNKMGLTILFIAHNLSVVKYFSDRIAVMYFGKIMELTTSDELFEHPLHPYTKSLLSAIPYPDPHYEKQRVRIEYNPAKQHDYSVDKPSLREITPGHYIHCNDAEFEQYKKELGL